MSIPATEMTQKKPVHFRVRELVENPVAGATAANAYVLVVERADTREVHRLAMPRFWVTPHAAAIDEAISTQEVYWVDWDYSTIPTWPLRENDSAHQRLLKAVGDRQLVTPGATPAG